MAQSNKNLDSRTQNLYEVEIGGIPFRLRSPHTEEVVQKIVKLVNDKIQQSLGSTKSDSLQTAAILACLNIAEEFLSFKTKAQAELGDVELKAQEIIANLESSRFPRVGLDL